MDIDLSSFIEKIEEAAKLRERDQKVTVIGDSYTFNTTYSTGSTFIINYPQPFYMTTVG